MLSFMDLKETQPVPWAANRLGVSVSIHIFGIGVLVGSSGESKQMP